ncbi:MAG: SRPBCC domain-containing protein [Candidatus Kariarchaeaceae archaeon]
MTNKSDLRIDKNYIISATLDEIWDCLTNGEISSFWQGQNCVIGTNVGDKIELFGGWVTGRILTLNSKLELSYTWNVSEWGPEIEPSVVSYTLKQMNAELTEVSVSHTNLPNMEERDSHDKGWDEQFFDPLIEFLRNTTN